MKSNADSAVWGSFPPADFCESASPAIRLSSSPREAYDLDGLARGLSSDFPLHSPSELRRAIVIASEDLWPRKDSIDILDRARQQLLEGFLR